MYQWTKQTKDCENIEDLTNTMNKFDFVNYFSELNKRKKYIIFKPTLDIKNKVPVLSQ